MDTVKLSSKGHILIPKRIRDALHLPVGAEFVVSRTSTGLSLTPTTLFPKATPSQVRGVLAKPGRKLPAQADLRNAIQRRLRAADDASK